MKLKMIRSLIFYANQIAFRKFFIANTPARLITTKVNNSNRIEHEKLCRAEMHFHFMSGNNCPDPNQITEDEWQYIFNLTSKHQRKRHYKYLSNKQVNARQNNEADSLRKAILENTHTQIKKERQENKHIVYGLGQNSLLLRINRTTMNTWTNLRLHRAKLFGQKVLIDCTFDYEMNDREIRSTSWSMQKGYTTNREHKLPLDMHFFCNESYNPSFDNLHKQIPTLIGQKSLYEIHYECYTNLFPTERLLVLTPDSTNIFQYNFDDIYVIGGIVDRGHSTPKMLAKAKRLGLRTARLPLKYSGPGKSHELPLHNVIDILCECQMSRNLMKILESFGPKAIRPREYRYFK